MLTKELIQEKLPGKELSEIKSLTMWGNELENVDIIQELKNIEVVSLSLNKIASLQPFENLANLRELYLRKNKIEKLEELNYLKNCKKLEILWLEQNPICDHDNYKEKVKELLPGLKKLDNVKINDEGRGLKSLTEISELYEFDNDSNNKIEKCINIRGKDKDECEDDMVNTMKTSINDNKENFSVGKDISNINQEYPDQNDAKSDINKETTKSNTQNHAKNNSKISLEKQSDVSTEFNLGDNFLNDFMPENGKNTLFVSENRMKINGENDERNENKAENNQNCPNLNQINRMQSSKLPQETQLLNNILKNIDTSQTILRENDRKVNNILKDFDVSTVDTVGNTRTEFGGVEKESNMNYLNKLEEEEQSKNQKLNNIEDIQKYFNGDEISDLSTSKIRNNDGLMRSTVSHYRTRTPNNDSLLRIRERNVRENKGDNFYNKIQSNVINNYGFVGGNYGVRIDGGGGYDMNYHNGHNVKKMDVNYKPVFNYNSNSPQNPSHKLSAIISLVEELNLENLIHVRNKITRMLNSNINNT